MARSIANGNAAMKPTGISVQVRNHANSAWIDLCSPATFGFTSAFPGKSRVQGLSLSYSNERWSGSLTLINHAPFRATNESLDPGHTSDFNVGDVPLLGAYHAVKIFMAKGGGTAALVFQGFVGPGTTTSGEDVEGDDTITVDLVGVMQPYLDYIIDKDEGLAYTDTYISTAVERDMLNQILVDYGFADGGVEIVDDPEYYCHSYEIGDTSIGEAIQRPVHSIGYMLQERYIAGDNESDGAFKLAVVDPDRNIGTPIGPGDEDVDLGGNIRAARLSYSEANVRTKVRVVYRSRFNDKQESATSENDTARQKYGLPDGTGRKHRYMRIVESDDSIIDTYPEAAQMAEYALWDLMEPCPDAEIQIPWLVLNVEGGDVVKASTQEETLYIGVTDISLNLAAGDAVGNTTIKGALKRRVGSRSYWFARGRTDWIGQHDRARDNRNAPTPSPPAQVDARGVWGEGIAGDAVPVLSVSWTGVRAHNLAGYRVRYKLVELAATGAATSGSTTTLVDTSASWPNNGYAGAYVWLKDTSRTSPAIEILSNSPIALAFPAISVAVGVGEEYEILVPTGDWTYITTDLYPYVQIPGLPEGQRAIIEVAAVPVRDDR